jgi:hypothetical protein
MNMFTSPLNTIQVSHPASKGRIKISSLKANGTLPCELNLKLWPA